MMVAQPGCVRVCEREHLMVIQVEGWGTMRQSLALRRFAEQCLAKGITGCRVDLCRCTYMDSTFLGTLLFVKRAVERHEGAEFAFVAVSPECSRLLRQMGLDRFFHVGAGTESAEGEWTELC